MGIKDPFENSRIRTIFNTNIDFLRKTLKFDTLG